MYAQADLRHCWSQHHIVGNLCRGSNNLNAFLASSDFCCLLITFANRLAQSVMCLATDACLTADPGVLSLILARSHTFLEIDHEIISTVIPLPSAESFKKGFVSDKRKYVREVLVNRLFKLAQEEVWLGELTIPP